MDQGEERVKSLDQEIAKISKSTRTTVPALVSLHDLLRQKYSWYYNWHLNPWSSKIHTAILSLVVVVFLAIGSISLYGLPRPAKAAADFTCTFTGLADNFWSIPENWDNCNGGYPGQGASSYDVSIPAGISVILDVNNIDLTNGGTAGGSITVGEDLNTSNNNITVLNLTISASTTLTAGSSTITVKGNWDSSAAGAVFTYGTSTINMTGSSSSINTGGSGTGKPIYNLTYTTAGGTLTATANYIVLYGSLTVGSASGAKASINSGAYIFYSYANSNPVVFNGTYNGTPGYNIDSLQFSFRPSQNLSIPIDSGGTTRYGSVYFQSITNNTTFSLQGDISTSSISIYPVTNGKTATLDTNGYNLTGRWAMQVGHGSQTNWYAQVVNNSVSADSTITLTSTLTIYASDASGVNKIDASGTKTINMSVGGNWTNNDTFTAGASTVTFNGTASQQIITSTATVNNTFKNLTFNNGTNTNTLTLNPTSGTPTLDVDGLLTITKGTLSPGAYNMTIGGGLSFSDTTNGLLTRGAGTLTFDGTGTWTDNRTTKASLGTIVVGGSSATLTLGSSVKADVITINATDILNLASSGYTLELAGTGSAQTVLTVSGTLTPGTSTVKYTATNSGGTVSVTTTTYNSLQFTPASAETYDMTGNLTGGNALTGNLTIDANATLDAVNGSNYNLTCVNVTINGTYTARASTITVSGNWNSSTGTVNYGTSTVAITGSGTITTKSWAYNFYDLKTAYTGQSPTWVNNGIIAHQLILNGDATGSLNGTQSWYGPSMWGTGSGYDMITTNGATLGSTMTVTFGNAATIPATVAYPNVTFAYNGTQTLGGSISAISVGIYGTANNTCTLDLNGYTLTLSGNLDVGNSGTNTRYGKIVNSSQASNATLTVTGNLTLVNGAVAGSNQLDASGTGGAPKTINIGVGGNWTVNNGTFTAGTSTVNFTKSSSTQTLNSGGTGAGKAFNHLQHTGAGTLQLLTNNLDIDGNFTNSAGIFDTNSLDISVAGSVDLTTGSFTQGTRTITLDGSGAQSFTAGGTGAGHTPYNITSTNASAAGVTFADSLTLAASGTLADNTGSSKLTFTAGSTYTIPTLDLDGGVGSLVTLRSSSDGTDWNLNVTNAPTLTYVDAKDSDASGGALVTANTSNDSGNNTNWSFGGGVTYISGTVYTAEDKSTNIGAGKTIGLSVNGAAKNTTETIAGGVFSFNSVGVAANDTLTFFIDDEVEKGNLITQVLNSTNDITGLEMYTNDIAFRHETAGPVTNTLLATADNLADDDMFFSVDGSNNATFTKKLWIESGFTYTPGGNATVNDSTEIRATATLNLGSSGYILTLGGTAATPLVVSGTLSTGTNSTVKYTTVNGSGNVNVTTTTYNSLQLSGAETYDMTGNLTTPNNLTGDLTVDNGATFSPGTYDLQLTGNTTNAGNFGSGTVSGAHTLNKGLTNQATGNYKATSGTTTITAGGVAGIFTDSGIFNHNNGKFNFNNNLSGITVTPSASTVFYDVDISGIAGPPTVVGLSTNPLVVANNLTINGNGKLTTNNIAISVGGNWANSGTFTAGSGTVTFNGTATGKTINPGASSFYNLIFNGSGGAWSPLTNTVTVTNDLTMTAGTFDTSNGTANVTVNGNVYGTAGIINFTITNTFTQSIVTTPKTFGTTSGSTNWTFNNLIFRNSSAEAFTIITASGGTGQIIVGGTLTTGDASDFDTTTLDNETNDRIIDAANVTISSKGVLQASSTASFTVSGNWANSGTFTANSGTVTFDKGSDTQTLNSGGTGAGKLFNNLSHSGAGTLQLLTNALDVNGVFTNSNGTFDANNLNVNVADDFLISGGTFSPKVGGGATTQTVVFDGTNEATISGSTTFNNLTMDTTTDGAKTIKFTAGTTQTITAGKTWTLDGALGKVLTLRSTSDTNAWYFNISAGFTSGDYIDVKDSYSANANKITAGADSINSGNNDGWIFEPLAPSAATLVNVDPNGATSFNTTWSDNSNNETGFKVYVSTLANADCSLATYPGSPDYTTAADAESQLVTGKSVNTQYCAKVVATNAYGDSSPAYGGPLYTYANTPAAPAVVANSWDAANGNSLTVVINANSNPAATEFAISCDATPTNWLQNDGSCAGAAVWKTKANWETGTTNYLKNLTADTDYTLLTKARNGDNTETADSPTTGPTMTAPAQPTGLAHTSNTTTSITWNLNDNAVVPDGYHLLNNAASEVLETSATSDFVQNQADAGGTPLTANTQYTTRTRAYRGAITGQPTAADTTAAYTSIETPTGITFGTITTSSIGISAAGTLSNLTSGSSGLYFTETSGNVGGGGTGFLAWTQTNSLSDSGLSVNTQYTYKVKARNGDGDETAETATSSKYTLANVPAAPTVNQVSSSSLQVIVNANSNPAATQFAIYNSTLGQYIQADGTNGDTTIWQNYLIWGGTSGTTNVGLEGTTTYTYKVKARNGDNVETAFSSSTSQTTGTEPTPTPSVSVTPTQTTSPSQDTQAPTAPTNLRATGLGAITLTLAWDPSVDDVGVKGYEIYNAETGIKVGTTANTSFGFTGLTPKTTYKFYVRAFDAVPYYSPNSEVVSLTTRESRTAEEQAIEEQGGLVAFLVIGSLSKEAIVGKPLTNNIKLTAADAGGRIVARYTKSVHFSSTDAFANLSYSESRPYTFVLEDTGVHTFASTDFVFNTAGRQQLTVSDNSIQSTVEIRVNSSLATAFARTATVVGGFLSSPEGVSNINLAIAALIAAALIMPVLVNGFAGPHNLLPQLLYGLTYLGQILGLRRRRRTWGVVFNSQTGLPVPFAAVKLLDDKKHLVELGISDGQGRYGLTAKHGTFTLQVSRADFVFPSVEKRSSFYEKVYRGTPIKITNASQGIAFNIPLDPRTGSGYGSTLWILMISLKRLTQKVLLPLFASGTIFAIIVMVLNFSLIYVIFLAYCLSMIVFNLAWLGRRVPATGTVSDVYSRPIRGAIVQIYYKHDNRLFDTDVSRKEGRFRFKVPPGVYYLAAAKPKFIDTKTHLMYLKKGQKKETISSINIQLKKE